MAGRGLRDGIASYVPWWLSNRPGQNVGYKVIFNCARVLDVFLRFAQEGVQAAWPGLGTTTALPYIGQSRGIIRGEAETDASYEARLRAWLDTWLNAGSDRVLATQIQAYLGNTPRVTIVTRGGVWTTLASDGTYTVAVSPWDWDSVSNPERAGWWSDLWIIIYPCEWPVTGATLAGLVGTWGTSQGFGTGHEVPRAAVDAILGLVRQWKGAHTFLQSIVWSYDATLFTPGGPNLPDGRWGKWYKLSGSTCLPSRIATGALRYWDPGIE